MDQYEKEILDLTKQLTELEVGKPKSILGVVNLVYRLVEETARRHRKKEKLSEDFKKKLASKVIKDVIEILKEKKLLDNFLIENLKLDSFIEVIDDINDIYNSDLVQGCCFKKKKKKKKDNLKKIKIIN